MLLEALCYKWEVLVLGCRLVLGQEQEEAVLVLVAVVDKQAAAAVAAGNVVEEEEHYTGTDGVYSVG